MVSALSAVSNHANVSKALERSAIIIRATPEDILTRRRVPLVPATVRLHRLPCDCEGREPLCHTAAHFRVPNYPFNWNHIQIKQLNGEKIDRSAEPAESETPTGCRLGGV